MVPPSAGMYLLTSPASQRKTYGKQMTALPYRIRAPTCEAQKRDPDLLGEENHFESFLFAKVYIYIYIYIHVCVRVNIYVYIFLHIYVYVCACVCVCVDKQKNNK